MKKLFISLFLVLILVQLVACAGTEESSRSENETTGISSSMASDVSTDSSEENRKKAPSPAPKKSSASSTGSTSEKVVSDGTKSPAPQNNVPRVGEKSKPDSEKPETQPGGNVSKLSDSQSDPEPVNTQPTEKPVLRPTAQPQKTTPPKVQSTPVPKPTEVPAPTEAPTPEPTQEPTPAPTCEPEPEPEPEPSYNWDYSIVISVAMANCSAEWNEKAIESGCTIYTSDSAGSAEDMGVLIAATVNRSGRKYFYVETDGTNWYIYGDPILADVICDQIVHDSYRIVIDCKDSMRKRKGVKD